MAQAGTKDNIFEQINHIEWPSHWRIWVYVSGHKLDKAATDKLQTAWEEFSNQWSAHGQALKSDMVFLQDQILLIAVDERQAKTTGCSLDKMTHFVHSIQSELGAVFMDRSGLYVYNAEAAQWQSLDRIAFKKAYEKSEIDDSTLVIDTLIDTADNLSDTLIKELRNSWHSKIV